MNQQKRINKIIEAVEARIQDEIGSLLGADFTLVSGDRKLVSKEAVFESRQGKQICAQMDLTGEITGKGCLLVGIKDAIRLGGTLIMLPSGELEEVIAREEYSAEIEDSYGEIANIIAGSFTKDFEELYSKSFRFVRKEQEIVVPAKVDVDSDNPIENQLYYWVSSSMVLDGRPMGDMLMLMPAETFGLQEQENSGAGNKTPDKNATPDKQPAVAQGKSPKEEEVSDAGYNVEETASNAHVPDPEKKPPVGPKFDAAKHKKKVDNLLAECGKKMESEVGSLLGVEITLSDPENQLLSKEEFFDDHVTGRQIMAIMEVVGDAQDKSYLLISIKDAIHLGGILIMLPPAELENVIAANDFGEDSRDAYGEIANIISGVYTSVFEEQYSRKVRFIRKEIQEVVPANVDAASDEPIPDITYYSSSISMAIGGKPLGEMHMLFPAEMLRIDVPKDKAESNASSTAGNQDQKNEPVKKAAPEKVQEANSASISASGAGKKSHPSVQIDVKKHQKRVDKVLAACSQKMADEISALLGTDVKMTHLENMLVSKEEFFFDEVSGKQMIADMDVVGELEGKSYLSVGLRDAIRAGGSLIMLPTAELESVVAEEDLTEDIQDAYGEIANIISGVYTACFEEQYIKKIRFIKTGLQQVMPMKVDIDADEPMPNQDYYLSRMGLVLGELELGKVNVLFPADLLGLEGLRSVDAADGEPVEGSFKGQIFDDQEKRFDAETTSGATESKSPDILVVGDDEAEAVKIAGVLQKSGFIVKVLSFKDNLHNYMPGNLKAVYLVMRVVNEQAFGVAIKVSSVCSVPLIAAGPGWTRTKVIKAVKYGVQDILLTPASHEDIEENVNNNLFELAA